MAKEKSRKGSGLQSEARGSAAPLSPGVAQKKPGEGEALPATAGATADRRASSGLHPPSGQVTITAGERGPVAGKDSNPQGAKVVAPNVSSAELGAATFIALVTKGIQSWVAAGDLLVVWLKQVPQARELIVKQAPWISPATLEMFERIGRRSLFPKVLLLPPMLAERVGRLSYAEQERMCAKPECEIRAAVTKANRSKASQKNWDTGNHAISRQPREHSHVANLPCAGYWRVTVANGKAAIEKCESSPSAVPVVLHDGKYVVLQVLGGYQSESDETPVPKSDAIHDELTPAEKRWREFKNDK